MISIPREVARRLGYYVYMYIDPRSNQPFYVGKGQNERILAHLAAQGESRKVSVLEELRNARLEPRLEVLAHGLHDEETALRIEAAVIDLCGLDQLVNEVRGWRSIQLGRMSLMELISYYAPKPITILEPALLIRVNRLYRHAMSEAELYDVTRGVWRFSKRRTSAKLALAVFEGVVREVYEIEQWHSAGTTTYITRASDDVNREERWEFTGQKADTAIRDCYLGGSVESYFPRGLQSPVVYVNV